MIREWELPHSWSWSNVEGIVSSEKYSVVDGPFGSNMKTSDYVDDGIPVLQGKNITNNSFKWFDIRYVSEVKADELSRSSVRLGDILIVKIGSIGYAAELTDLKNYPFAIIPANLAKITIDENIIDKRYMLHWLASVNVKRHFESVASKTAQPALSLGKIKELPVPVPSLAEQKRIAAILDKANVLRRKRQQANELADQFLRAVFLDMFGDPVKNPNGWEDLPLNDLLAKPLQNGAYYPREQYLDSGVEMVHMSDAFYDVIERGNLKRVVVPLPDVAKYSLSHNDILISRRSLNLEGAAKPSLIPMSDEPLIFESSMIRVSPDKNKLLPKYLFAFLSHPLVKAHRVFQYVTGATIKGISQSNLAKVKILVPNMGQQKKFVCSMERIDQLKQRSSKCSSDIDSLFRSISQKAFTGEL